MTDVTEQQGKSDYREPGRGKVGNVNYDDAVRQMMQRGEIRFGRHWLSRRTDALDENQTAYILDCCRRIEPDPESLLTFLEVFFKDWNGTRPPSFGQFLQYVSHRKKEETLYQDTTQRKDACPLCGGTGRLPVVLPACLGRSEVPHWSSQSYEPGQPWTGDRRLINDRSVVCVCRSQSSDQLRIRDQHQQWYTKAAKGEWSLHPGETFRVQRAINRYMKRWAQNDWRPAAPLQGYEGTRMQNSEIRSFPQRQHVNV